MHSYGLHCSGVPTIADRPGEATRVQNRRCEREHRTPHLSPTPETALCRRRCGASTRGERDGGVLNARRLVASRYFTIYDVLCPSDSESWNPPESTRIQAIYPNPPESTRIRPSTKSVRFRMRLAAVTAYNSVSDLVSKIWYRIPFDQSDPSITKMPPTDPRTSDRVAILE